MAKQQGENNKAIDPAAMLLLEKARSYLVEMIDLQGTKVSFNPIAIRPKLAQSNTAQTRWISWEDTGNGALFEFQSIRVDGEKDQVRLIITTADVQLILSPLTLKLFNEHLKPIVAGPLSFSSDQEVKNYYLDTLFY